jgi:exopolyphosphatase/guanosine-5'-triphosphate,3'-diphosphate pyrophosphatase
VHVAVVDIGTNSTRLLIADIDPSPGGPIEEIVRRSKVTRLGAGVDASGQLSDAAIGRVRATLVEYRGEISAHACERNVALMTSAVRDASNGPAFAAQVRDDFGLEARILEGEQEAELTFLGAMSSREGRDTRTVVIDIGGGSTEFVIGADHEAGFHVSLHAGVVRMSERHIDNDPPLPAELGELAKDVRRVLDDGLPAAERREVSAAVAVAGTATSAASIDQELDPYDPARVEGYELTTDTVARLLERLAAMDEAQRRAVVGLNPDRAPTIVAGMILLTEAMRAFGLDRVEVSEHDILYGGALRLAGRD